MSNIHLLYAGGTFGSYGNPLTTLTANEFLPKFLPTLQYTGLKFTVLDNNLIKDSSNFSPDDFFALYRLINDAYFAGAKKIILITGTDTLAYLAAFLHYALGELPLSLVVTGSMLPFFEPNTQPLQVNQNSDAKANFDNALAFLTEKTPNRGVYVSFYQHIYYANSVQKIHSNAKNAFTGTIFNSTLHPSQTLAITQSITPAVIHTLYCVPNDSTQLSNQLKRLADYPTSAVIIIGFGAGNMPYSNELAQCLQQLTNNGFLVIMTTACPYGDVNQTYATGVWQYQFGAVSGDKLKIPALYAKALWLCSTQPIEHRKTLWHTIEDCQ